MEKFIGNVSVDSGQILIVDPCYLGEYDANEMTTRTGIRHKETGRKYFCGKNDGYSPSIPRWDTPIEAEGGKCMNDLSELPEWESYRESPDKGKFSYAGICGVTLDKPGAGECAAAGLATCVASGTAYGDGNYPVYANIDKDGRILSVTIKFT